MKDNIPHNVLADPNMVDPELEEIETQAEAELAEVANNENLVLVEPEQVRTYQVNYLDGETVIRIQLKPTEEHPDGEVLEMVQPMNLAEQTHMAQPAAIFATHIATQMKAMEAEGETETLG